MSTTVVSTKSNTVHLMAKTKHISFHQFMAIGANGVTLGSVKYLVETGSLTGGRDLATIPPPPRMVTIVATTNMATERSTT